MGLPPPQRSSSNPPKDRPPLPRNAILPDKLPSPKASRISNHLPAELPQPRVSAVSDKQKEALQNSSFGKNDISPADPNQVLAFDLNADNLTALEEVIARSVNADDSDISTPARFDQPFTARNSVQTERNTYVPMDNDSEDDFNQEHYDAYGHTHEYAGGSLKNF